jgi:hypothetical protein
MVAAFPEIRDGLVGSDKRRFGHLTSALIYRA